MDLNGYLNNNTETNLLKRFAVVGKQEAFNRKLHYLERLAEDEKWHFKGGPGDAQDDFYVLFYYIVHTFDRCFKQRKIHVTAQEDAAVFNTGLMTSAGEEIVCVFVKASTYNAQNPLSCYWYLKGFEKEGSREFMQLGLQVPPMATYFDDYADLYFNPDHEIVLNFHHIFADNHDRLPPEMQQLDESTASKVFNGFLDYTKKRIRRNSRIPVPQFYNDKIMFLVPVKAFGDTPIVLALEKYGNEQYRGNTILTMNMAYNCARLLARPESNWLLPS